jgi:hypothetical protein
MDVIDWRIIERDGTPYLVQIVPDSDIGPKDYDCYDERDTSAWMRGDWRFVVVRVSASPDRADCVGGVEWGDLPGAEAPCGWSYVEDHLLSDIIGSGL